MTTLLDRLRHLDRYLRPLAWASLVANIAIVVTGGAVRLTGSGLGCPTWPRCTDESFTPHGTLDFHSAIEFGNRMLTFVLTAIAVATFVAAWQSRRRALRRLALVLALGIPLQAVIGGVTVLTGLNSWVVSLHLLLSMAMVGVAALLVRRLDQPAGWHTGALPWLGWAVYAVTWLVLVIGTVVTGAGPHAGDVDTERNGLDPAQLSQLHADAVFLLIGLTVGLLIAVRMSPHVDDVTSRRATRAVTTLLVVELGQGLIGFVQYATDLPELLVGAHLLGAGLVAASASWALFAVADSRPSGPGGSGEASRAAAGDDAGDAAWLRS